jgi:hypothetical protein
VVIDPFTPKTMEILVWIMIENKQICNGILPGENYSWQVNVCEEMPQAAADSQHSALSTCLQILAA